MRVLRFIRAFLQNCKKHVFLDASLHEQAFGQQFLRIIASVRKRLVTIKNKAISGKTENIMWDCPTKAMPSTSPQRERLISETRKAIPPK